MLTRSISLAALVACASCGNSTPSDPAGVGSPVGAWVFDADETRRMTEEYIASLPAKEQGGAKLALAFISVMSGELTLASDGSLGGTLAVKMDAEKPPIETKTSGTWAKADGLVRLTYVDPAPSTMTCDHGASHLRCKDPQGKATAYKRK